MNEAKLPIKTRIAMWWLIVMGVLLVICNAALMFLLAAHNFAQIIDAYSGPSLNPFWFLIPLVGSILTICSGISLFRKSKRAWIAAIIAIFIAMIYFIGVYLFLSIERLRPGIIYHSYLVTMTILISGLLIYITPMILLILDRKNYFAMIRQREAEKKAEL